MYHFIKSSQQPPEKNGTQKPVQGHKGDYMVGGSRQPSSILRPAPLCNTTIHILMNAAMLG